MGEGWCDNPSGSRPNFFGRQHLTFDKGGKGVGDFRGIVRFFEGSMSVQLYRYTHENINVLSVRKILSAVLAIYFTVQFNDKSDYIN